MIMAKLTSARNIFQSSQSLPINYLFQFHCTWYFNWLGNNMQTVNNILIFSMELKSVLLCSSSVLQESFVWMKKYLKLQFFWGFFSYHNPFLPIYLFIICANEHISSLTEMTFTTHTYTCFQIYNSHKKVNSNEGIS